MTYFSLIYISILNNLGPDHIYIFFFSCQLAERIFLNKIWHQYNLANSKHLCKTIWHASLVAQRLKRLPAMWETWVRSLGQEDPLKKEMATHSSILAWKILWTEKPGRVQSMGSQRVGHDWATKHKHNENRIKIKGLPLLVLVTVVSGMFKNVFYTVI